MKINRSYIAFQPSPRRTRYCRIHKSSLIILAGLNFSLILSNRRMNLSNRNLLVNPSLKWWFSMNPAIQMKQYSAELSPKIRKRQSLSRNNVQKTQTATSLPMTALASKTTKKSKFIYSVNCVTKICRTLLPVEICQEARGGSANKMRLVTTTWRCKQFAA